MTDPDMKNLERKARARVHAKKGFYVHFGVYAIVSLFLVAINLLTSPFQLWFYFPVLSWGLAVAIHYLVTFGVPGTDILSQEWEEREMDREMYILQRKREVDQQKLPERPLTSEKEEQLELRKPVKLKKHQDEDLV